MKLVGINNKSKTATAEINNKHSIVGINNKSKITTTEIININKNNSNEFAKSSNDINTENNNSKIDVETEINNSSNIESNQNSLNQNILNTINQNNINQNVINSNDFNFNTLLGRNVFIYNFQNSGDFVMSSMPLFNNNNNNNNQNNNGTQGAPSYEENEPLPEYSDIDKSVEKQQFK